MPRKVPTNRCAAGYWGGDPNCLIRGLQVPDKVKALLQTKLIAMGRPVELWLPVAPSTPGVIPCTCDKNTRPGSDFRCLSCYGMRYVPGYLRFLHQTIWFSSAEYTSFTLTDVERDTTIKPNRLRLTAAALTGTIETGDKPFTNPDDLDWTYEAAVFRKTETTDVVTVEFSTDAGLTWIDITLINGVAKPTGTSGNIRFRITLTRAALTTDSPDFEIVRIRRRMPERMAVSSKVRDLQAGQILILRTWAIEQTVRQLAAGRQTTFQADKAWTTDLAFYDREIEPNSTDSLIKDRDAGPHPFYEHATGVTIGERFPIYQISYNDNFLDVLTHQAFFDRRAQDGELYNALVF